MRNYLIFGGLVAVAAAAGFYFNQPESNAAVQSTNDARLVADYTNVASQASGTIEQVLTHENREVAKGDLLVVLDDRDQRIAVETSQAAVAAAQARLKTLEGTKAVQTATIAQQEAAVASAKATQAFAQTDEARSRQLVERRSAAQKVLDQAVSNLAGAEASVLGADASLEAARSNLEVLQGQIEEAVAAIAQAEASLKNARLALSHTKISAPVSGTVGQFNARVGNYATPGQIMLSIVPLDQIYVEANFRETQLAHIAAGQMVEITVDALPGHSFAGKVDSIGPASGAIYSSIAPQNATGNFTKVAQRLPVRIALDPDQQGLGLMRAGMSVLPYITTTK